MLECLVERSINAGKGRDKEEKCAVIHDCRVCFGQKFLVILDMLEHVHSDESIG